MSNEASVFDSLLKLKIKAATPSDSRTVKSSIPTVMVSSAGVSDFVQPQQEAVRKIRRTSL
jgi:hypothetical protein